ncbi:hypothetical protein DF046_19550 [Burkholderia cepacia]|uniref:hypothetical protein n=1 Tax=Burkholderia cepacia TaxID=292 RepID=UPI00075E018F|nr:hypothetical protein [Burkholderia cepacia]KVL12386.1 hypothetical protein WJ46_28680 [Burkholderia cepacia]KVQ29033.1 hypothetical protein WK02_21200 [Burkholderia cepacia]KVZ22370.1 hypothetical protein WL14_21055 [Burkholderia cepacia]RQT51647.1 hypothetical protein DF046_19550 [Burkholderia cepacia]
MADQTQFKAVSSAIETLYHLNRLIQSAQQTGDVESVAAICEITLTDVGTKLDALLAEMGHGRTGYFESEVCHG